MRSHIAPTMQAALDDWDMVTPKLEELYKSLNDGNAVGAYNLDFKTLDAAASAVLSIFGWCLLY